MDWQPEKLCTSSGEYDLIVERFKNGYECDHAHHGWRWRVIHSGVVVAQGNSVEMNDAQKMAESNIPINN